MKGDEKCHICGKPATHFLFATFVCDDEECVEKARIQRGGPAGHQRIGAKEWLEQNEM
ncbi:MAG: hypothetical protein MUO94_03545 [Thermoplasmata archaeon]|jgi:hypothetical protein|nr:hypothetical protein [Thermoplasmata archaeon]